MSRVLVGRLIVPILTILCLPVWVHAGPQEDALDTGRLLAQLLDSGRVTIAKYQDLINAPAQDGSTFTPELFERELREEFRTRTNLDLDKISETPIPEMAKPLLTQLFKDSVKTVQTFQPVLSLPKMKYKGLIPATFGTETAHRFQNYSKIYLKQTAPSRLVRNPKNKPDDYEEKALEKMTGSSSSASPQRIFGELSDEGKLMRVMMPLYYGQACLNCHGEPKGERDISGYPREGGKLGELGGAISVKIPLQ